MSVCLSLSHSVTLSLCHSVTLSLCHFVALSLCHYHSHSLTLSLCHSRSLAESALHPGSAEPLSPLLDSLFMDALRFLAQVSNPLLFSRCRLEATRTINSHFLNSIVVFVACILAFKYGAVYQDGEVETLKCSLLKSLNSSKLAGSQFSENNFFFSLSTHVSSCKTDWGAHSVR